MSPKVKLASYAVMVLLAVIFAWGFYSSYSEVSRESAEATTEAPPPATNVVTTNSTNVAGAPSNAPAPVPAPAPPAHSAHGRMIGYLAAMIAALVGLGILIAYDVTQIIGSAAVDFLMDDRGEGQRDPEYERAEQAWAAGKHLEAIQMMRDFLKNNPREQYAALRIAEIYEKDLNNLLAAALEYEEILKKRLPAERWGWAAIHLCNLYSKIGQQDKTLALLQRIVDGYPKTGAAKKARSRLGIAEPEPEVKAAPEPEEEAAPAEESATGTAPTAIDPSQALAETIEQLSEPQEAPPPPPPKSNLPPGFRPKK